MKREVWEELVDRVVDDECADEERRALYEAAERNPEIREAIDSALRIRELMRRSAQATVPPEFSERLRLAIERSDVWVERETARPSARCERRGRRGARRLVWAATGAAISFAAVAFFAVENGGLSGVQVALNVKPEEKDGALGNLEDLSALNVASETRAVSDSPNRNSIDAALPNAIIPPRNEGKTPDVLPAAIPSGFYTRRVLAAEDARRAVEAFARFCNKINVEWKKIDGDFELLIEKTTPATRNEILSWLDENAPEIGPRAKNNFEETWQEDDKNEIDVRISFFIAETSDGAIKE